MKDQILAILSERKGGVDEKSSKTVFTTLMDSDLPPEELSLTRLQHEAISIIGAGIETTKRALSVASFYILDNPAILARLCEELISAIPNPETPPPLEVYEKLPYLSACIEEGTFFSPAPSVLKQSKPLIALLPFSSSTLVLRYLSAHSPHLRDTNYRV